MGMDPKGLRSFPHGAQGYEQTLEQVAWVLTWPVIYPVL